MRNAVIDATPAVTVAIAAIAAAWPAYATLRRAKPGRARSAIAYLLGFFSGLAATAAMAVFAEDITPQPATVATAGLLASFVAPFIGLVHAKLRGPQRRQRQRFAAAGRPPHAARQL